MRQGLAGAGARMMDKDEPHVARDPDVAEEAAAFSARDAASVGDGDTVSEGIDRDLAARFGYALGHWLGPWERRRIFMDDLFLTDEQAGRPDLPSVWVIACAHCGAQLPDQARLARRNALLTDWCPWLVIITQERRAAAAALYRRWSRSLGQEPGPWSGEDSPIPTSDGA